MVGTRQGGKGGREEGKEGDKGGEAKGGVRSMFVATGPGEGGRGKEEGS